MTKDRVLALDPEVQRNHEADLEAPDTDDETAAQNRKTKKNPKVQNDDDHDLTLDHDAADDHDRAPKDDQNI